MSVVDCLIEDDRWLELGLSGLAEVAVCETLKACALPDDLSLALLAADDDRIAALNGQFRGKAAPTNVLSWPSGPWTPQDLPEDGELGDIALAYDTCAAEAAAQGKPLSDHVTHLIVHGTLHLLGFDHESDAEAAEMEGIEVQILARLDLPDPYCAVGDDTP